MPLNPFQSRQCGAAECKRRYRNERQCTFQRTYRESSGTSYRNQFKRVPAVPKTHTCVVCGQSWPSKRTADSSYCSTQCRSNGEWYLNNGTAPRAPSRQAAARQRLRTAARGTRSARTWTAGICQSCGSAYVALGTGPRFCSQPCKQRERQARRRARAAGANVERADRIAVYQRDRWICQLCSLPVNRTATVPALDAPTLDHRIALARGGPHTIGNLQTAHFYCNSIKGDRDSV